MAMTPAQRLAALRGTDSSQPYTVFKDSDVVETPQSIASKINSLVGAIEPNAIKGYVPPQDLVSSVIKELKTGQTRLEAKDILNLPQTTPRRIDTSDERWHGGGLASVFHDTTLTGDGTSTSPLSVVSSGGGGTPGGNVNTVQFNNPLGTFAGSDQFEWDDTNKILSLDKGTGEGDGVKITGGTSDIDIVTDPTTVNSTSSGDINVSAGSGTGNFSSGGNINISASSQSGSSTTGGYIQLTGGTNGTDAGSNYSGGYIELDGGSQGSGFGGRVTIMGSNGYTNDVEGMVWINGGKSSVTGKLSPVMINGQVQFGNWGSINTAFNTGAAGIILMIQDCATPTTSTPVNGGILYSTGGALHWLGSSGTDTVIASA